ncbi:MAG: hypothetical protein M3R07_05190 [Gemmatimonadota bacterium]|nr:hypothetical protein [Gemmatimonadota bacterium]
MTITNETDAKNEIVFTTMKRRGGFMGIPVVGVGWWYQNTRIVFTSCATGLDVRHATRLADLRVSVHLLECGATGGAH